MIDLTPLGIVTDDWSTRLLVTLQAREAARTAQTQAHALGWSLSWTEPTPYSWRVTVTNSAGGEIARSEVLRPSWWERDGTGERRMAEAEVEVLRRATRGGRA